MKLLIFSLAYYPDHVGGAEVAIKEITDRIPHTELTFHLITLRFDTAQQKEEHIGHVQVHRVGFGGRYIAKILFIPLAVLKARKLHKKERIDGMRAMMTYMLFPTVLSRFVGVKVPYTLTLQDGDPFERVFKRPHIRPFTFLLKKGFKDANVIQTISTFLAHWAKEMNALCPIEVIPNGVALDVFNARNVKTDRVALREENDIPQDATVLVSTSRLVHKNGYDSVIRALPLLPPSVILLAIGKGEEEHALKNMAKKYDVADRVIFLGHVEYTDIPAYLAMSDIFIRPSRSEGMGNSFIEAMAMKLPVIATQEGGLADFIFDRTRNPKKQPTAWAVDVDSPEQIATAVEDISSHPEQTARVTTNAYDMVSKKYKWSTIARDMQERVFARLFEK